jgi:hypothetical protein
MMNTNPFNFKLILTLWCGEKRTINNMWAGEFATLCKHFLQLFKFLNKFMHTQFQSHLLYTNKYRVMFVPKIPIIMHMNIHFTIEWERLRGWEWGPKAVQNARRMRNILNALLIFCSLHSPLNIMCIIWIFLPPFPFIHVT